jgi:hypothetical protein
LLPQVAAVFIVASALAASCGNGGPDRIEVRVMSASLRDESTLVLSGGLCALRDKRVAMSESPDRVSVRITAKNPGDGPHGLCLGGTVVHLKAPLGGRLLIVGQDQREVAVENREAP